MWLESWSPGKFRKEVGICTSPSEGDSGLDPWPTVGPNGWSESAHGELKEMLIIRCWESCTVCVISKWLVI